MGKKKFTDGLDDLMNDEGTWQESAPERTSAAPRVKKSSGKKTFATDLDALLDEAMQESIEKFESGKPRENKIRKKNNPKGTERFSGIDALIRQTINVEELDAEGIKKRLTVAVDKPKLEQLKLIARLENSYLKDLMVEVIDEYIHSYAREKGLDL